MKHGFLNFLQLALPIVVILAILPYKEVVSFSASRVVSTEEGSVFSIITLDDEEESRAFRQAKTGSGNSNNSAGLGSGLKADLLMRELIADDISRDAGIEVEISQLALPPVIFELGAYIPSSAAAKPEQLPMVKVAKDRRMPVFSRAELLNLPD